VAKFYGELKSLVDELEMHQPVVTNAATLRGYHQDLAVSKFLFGLSPTVRFQVRCQILGGDNIPMLIVTFSRVMRVSTGAGYPLHCLWFSLPCTLDVIEVVVVTLEDIAHLARDTMFLVDD